MGDNLSLVRPCKRDNAIKIAAFAIEFSGALSEQIIQDVIAFYHTDDSLSKELPRKQTHEAVTLQFDSPQNISSKALGGVTFDRLTPSGNQEWAINLRSNALIITCSEYTRWNEIWPKAKSYILKICTKLKSVGINAVGMEYVDEFCIEDDRANWEMALFRQSSKYLPSNIYELKDLWHSHHGFFSKQGYPLELKTLNKIEVDCLMESTGQHDQFGQKKTVSIKTHHKSSLQGVLKIENEKFDRILEGIISGNHKLNKEILKEVLSDSMLEKIHLES